MSRPYTSAPKLYNQQSHVDITHNQHNSESVTNYKPIFYVPKQPKPTQNIHDLQPSTQDNDIINSTRDFKKTIPRNINIDKERLYEDLNKYKEKYNLLKLENYKLRSKIQNQDEQIIRFAKDEQPVNRQQSQQARSLITVEQLAQASITLTLKKQVKELGDSLEDKEQEMNKIKRNVKLTKIYEIEAELKAYQDETLRLKHMIQQYLRTRYKGMTDQSLEDKYLAQLGQIEELQLIGVEQQDQIVSLSEALQQSLSTYKELEGSYQKIIRDKTLLQKILQDKEKDLDRLKGNETSKKTTYTSDGQLKIELEKKLIECNQLKNQNTLKERKNHELEKKLKEVTLDLTQKVNHEMKEKVNNKDKSEKYRIELNELQDKYQQLVFNSRIGVPLSIQTPGVLMRKQTFTSIHSDEEQSSTLGLKLSQHLSEDKNKVQFSGILRSTPTGHEHAMEPFKMIRRTTMKTLNTLSKLDVEQIGTELRYKLRAKQIRSSEIEFYLFTEVMKIQGYAILSDMIYQLQREPFSLPQNESVQLSRYLFEPMGEKDIIYNTTLRNDLSSIQQLFANLIGKYSLIIGDDKVLIHNIIRKKFQENIEDIKNILKYKKSQENSKLPGNCYSRDSFLIALVQTSLDSEQLDVFMQTIYEITNDFNIVDLDIINKHWPPQGQLLISKPSIVVVDKKLTDVREGIMNVIIKKEPEIVKRAIDAILAYGELNNLSIFDLRAIIDEDKSGYVDRRELERFLKRCEVQLDALELLECTDFFDEAGDGRISVNDVGSVLKRAKNKRTEEQNAPPSGRKLVDILTNTVAQYIINNMLLTGQDVKDIFSMIDEENFGHITKEEMRKFFRTKLIVPMSSSEFDEFFETFKKTKDGNLSYPEFAKIINPAIQAINDKAKASVK